MVCPGTRAQEMVEYVCMEVGTPGRWGNPPVHVISSFWYDHVYMIGGVTRQMLPHLYGVFHVHVNRPLDYT